ncbi:HAUS augmin-like complex subunit 1 isoform X1 [Sarcophilus harrisii]|uniref:HAUS augmin like complex subunit 1 n=1 Tax=Sarcophilus harrisii TaxID=9305 RepID=A0A7N4V7F0_SARHA|nr:HAUS augmin-like complex subunit 1 isoform X1 [Sarcophilus harrisii]
MWREPQTLQAEAMEGREEEQKEEEEEKAEKIALWLKKIFGDQPIPKYEVNPRTTDILYHLSECNKTRDRDVSLVIEDLKQKARDYESEAKYLQDLLMESVSLSFTSLSSIGSSYLNALVDSALVLETKDTSLASFIPAVNSLAADLFRTKARNEEMEVELNKLGKNLTATLILEKCLREDLKKAELHLSVEKARVDSRISNIDFLKAKSDDLRLRIKAAEEQLSARGMDDSLSHQSLMALSERCKTMETLYLLSDSMEMLRLAELKQQTAPLKKKLESYLDLMPNPSLAQVKIEEAKRELNSMDAELTKKVDMMELLPDQSKRRFT